MLVANDCDGGVVDGVRGTPFIRYPSASHGTDSAHERLLRIIENVDIPKIDGIQHCGLTGGMIR